MLQTSPWLYWLLYEDYNNSSIARESYISVTRELEEVLTGELVFLTFDRTFLDLAHAVHRRVQQACQMFACAQDVVQSKAKCVERSYCSLTRVRRSLDSWEQFNAQPTTAVTSGQNTIHQITDNSLIHCSRNTPLSVWRGFGEKNEPEWTGKAELLAGSRQSIKSYILTISRQWSLTSLDFQQMQHLNFGTRCTTPRTHG